MTVFSMSQRHVLSVMIFSVSDSINAKNQYEVVILGLFLNVNYTVQPFSEAN